MHYLNLENYNFPAKKIINNLEISNINLDALNMKIDSPDKMKEWKINDWANAWTKSFPTTLAFDLFIFMQFLLCFWY